MVDRFIAWGGRTFSGDTWHRVPFQPILYLFSWAVVVRVAISDRVPIQFDQIHPGTYVIWVIFGLLAPVLALLSWWMICRSPNPKSTWLGIYVRLAADIMQFSVLLTFHVAGVLSCAPCNLREDTVVRRYIVAASIVFVFLLILRDIWVILLTNRVADYLHSQEASPDD